MKMTRIRVEGFTISLDGYGAGPNQDIRNPLGVGGTDLHQWTGLTLLTNWTSCEKGVGSLF